MSIPSFLLHRLLAVLWLVLPAGLARAFPPSPYYTIFGTVRDEIGQVLTVENAKIVLLKGNVVVLKTPVTVGVQFDQNYELRIPIDMLRPSTAVYREDAIIARSGYAIAVEMNGRRYFPLGVASSLTSGGGSERERFDFTLGVDSDNDGLPDVWEEWQLLTCGEVPGPNGYDLTKLNAAGDLDKDGQTDTEEYLNGTFACDGSSRMFIEFKENNPALTTFEWGTVTGRSYALERSTDLRAWARVPFSVGQPGTPNEAFVATDTTTIQAFVIPGPENRVFYRLVIR